MEPTLISESSKHRDRMNELVFELSSERECVSAPACPEGMVEALGDLVRSMNCYYSNLIEGHDTLPIEIEQALAEDYSRRQENARTSSLRPRPHIATQRWIDEGALDRARRHGGMPLSETHYRFEARASYLICYGSPTRRPVNSESR